MAFVVPDDAVFFFFQPHFPVIEPNFSITSRLLTLCTQPSCLSMASAAAMAADCPSTMNTGSMRMLPKAMCEADRQNGTSRFSASCSCGVMLR